MNKRNQIDQLFSNRLEGARTAPSASAWDKLEANLQEEKKKGLLIWHRIAAAVIILIVSVFSWTFFNKEQPDTRHVNANPEFLNAPYPKLDGNGIVEIDNAIVQEILNQEKNKNVVQPIDKQLHLSGKQQVKTIKKVTQQIAQHKEPKSKNPQAIDDQNTNTGEMVASVENTENENITEVVTVATEAIAMKNTASTIENIEEVKVEEINISEEIKSSLPAISITYLGDNKVETGKKENKGNGKFSLKKVFKSAKKLANGDLIAELREAKDDLIGSGIKSLND